MKQIILASQSPRRKLLLEWAEIDFEVIVQDTDESYPGGLEPVSIAMHIAKNKAAAVRHRTSQQNIVIAADTLVVIDQEIIGKPHTREEAIQILSKLAGNKHSVITGVVLTGRGREVHFADTTDVWFHPLTLAQIEYYIDRYQPFDKAGAYAIQEWIGVIGIKKIEGDFYNVMGLPISRVIQELALIQEPS